jgi:hypothetical protein
MRFVVGRFSIAMLVAVEPVSRLDDFIRVPFQLYAGDPNWVPPLMMERRDALKAGGTPYLRRANVAMWIAWRDGRAVGRISAQIDPVNLERYPGVGHFGLLVAIDDAAVIDALVATAETWLKARGMTQSLGPMSLSINEELGLLVDGFDAPPMLMMPHDPPYIAAHLERLGYVKAHDLLAYTLDAAQVPESMKRILARPLSGNVTLRTIKWGEYKEEVRRMVDIFNDAWAENWGFIPFDAAEIELMARQLRPLIDRRLVWFAEVDGEPVAFIVCLPNLNEAIRDLDGHLLPFGWAKLLWRVKVRGLTSARVLLMGAQSRFNKTLLGGLLPFHLIGKAFEGVQAAGIRTLEFSWVLETNAPMRAIAETVCGKPSKTYRIYERSLAPNGAA